MEIYAVYNGKQSHFNDEINTQLGTAIDFISLQVIFNSSLDEFGSDEFDKFTLFNVDLKDIQAMFPFKIITINHQEQNLKYTMFKIILNDFASGHFVKSQKIVEINKNVFLESFSQNINTFNQKSYDDFITTGGYEYQAFVCSTSRVPC